MSWYNFPQAVQGGFGPDDDERKRRRRSYRDAGAPYESPGVAPGAAGHEASGPFEGQQAAYDAADQPLALGPTDLSRWQAPRQGAAVDLGSGVQQGRIRDDLAPVAATPLHYLEGPQGAVGAADIDADLEMKSGEAQEDIFPAAPPPQVVRRAAAAVQPFPAPASTPAQVLRSEAPYSGVPERPSYGPIRGKKPKRGAPYSTSARTAGRLEAPLSTWGYQDPAQESSQAMTVAGAASRSQQHSSSLRGSRVGGESFSRQGGARFNIPAGFGPARRSRRSAGAGAPYESRRGWQEALNREGAQHFGSKKWQSRAPKPGETAPQAPVFAPLYSKGGSQGFIKARGMKEWRSRAPTEAEHQRFPRGVQPSQAEEYLRHRQGTERGELHKFPRGVQPSQAAEYAGQRKRKVSFGGVTGIRPIPKGKEARFTPGGISGYVPSEEEKMQGAMQYGKMQGRELAKREHKKAQGALRRVRKENKQFIEALRKRGGEQLGARDQRIAQMQHAGKTLEARVQAGGQQLGARDRTIAQMQQAGQTLEGRVRAGSRQLTQRDAALRGKQQRIGQLLQEGRGLEAQHKKAIMSKDIDLMLKGQDYDELKGEANRRIQDLEKRINDGSADRESAQKEIDGLQKQLAAAMKKPEAKAPEQRQDLSELRKDLAELRASLKARPAAAAGAPPIVVQGGAGGGGASSAGGSSSGGAAAGGGPGGGARPDLSKIVEAVSKAVKGRPGAAKGKKKGAEGTKGITQARRSYTDKRKSKIAELRALKSRRLREFATKTKKLPKAERTKQRREYKARVEAQFKEAQQRFPTARGLKTVGAIRELIRKIDAFKAAK